MKKPNKEMRDNLIKMQRCRYTKDGREILNPKPKLALVGPAKPLSDIEKMEKMTKANQYISEMEKYTETWEEHNDFHIDDDVDEEFYNTNFTLVEDELPEKYPEPSEEAKKAADKFIEIADKIEKGEIDPDTLNMDFLKEKKVETPPASEETKPE